MYRNIFIVAFILISIMSLCANQKISLQNKNIEITWVKKKTGWILQQTIIKTPKKKNFSFTSPGTQTVIFSETMPKAFSVESFKTSHGTIFPEKIFKYSAHVWKSYTSPVALNTAGVPEITRGARLVNKNPLTFETKTESGIITIVYSLSQNKINVKQTFKALKTGYLGVSTPTLITSKPEDVSKALIPGYLMADSLSNDFIAAYCYGHFIPNRPVIYRDKSLTTPVAIFSGKGYTKALSTDIKYLEKPLDPAQNTYINWNVGFSIMNALSEISPTLYYSVLGQKNSYMRSGDEVVFEYRFMLSQNDWYDVFKQSVYDVSGFDKQQKIIRNKQSLIDRVFQMYEHLTDITTSRFRVVEDDKGMLLGAQDFGGGVAGSDKDAIENYRLKILEVKL